MWRCGSENAVWWSKFESRSEAAVLYCLFQSSTLISSGAAFRGTVMWRSVWIIRVHTSGRRSASELRPTGDSVVEPVVVDRWRSNSTSLQCSSAKVSQAKTRNDDRLLKSSTEWIRGSVWVVYSNAVVEAQVVRHMACGHILRWISKPRLERVS